MTKRSIKKYHSRFKTGRSLLLLTGITAHSCTLMADTAYSLSMTIDTHLNPAINQGHLDAMNTWLESNDCTITIQAASKNDSDLLFAVFAENDAPKNHIFLAKTRDDEPLKVVWLVHRSTGASELSSIRGQRVALLPKSSLLGHQVPIKQLTDAGVNTNDLTIYTSEEYQGAVALLLHGDVSAASAPMPLAKPWATANDLNILTNSETIYVSGIWQLTDNRMTTGCINAFASMKRESRQDLKMKLFPEWLQGFTINK
jgi:ABC-type phosphate/phosphonate transport system substrate-binding protein